MGLVTVTAGAWERAELQRNHRLGENASANNPGAVALLPGYEFHGDPTAPALPRPEELPHSAANLGGGCPEDVELPKQFRLFCREPVAMEDPARTVLMIGNSHMQHWVPVLEPLAPRTGGACSPSSSMGAPTRRPRNSRTPRRARPGSRAATRCSPPRTRTSCSCRAPSASRTGRRGKTRVRAPVADGTQVVGIRDTPRFHDASAECAALRSLESSECEIVAPMLDTPDP